MVAIYEYDGLNRRVKKHIDTEASFDVCRSVAMRTERPFWALTLLAVCLLAAPALGTRPSRPPPDHSAGEVRPVHRAERMEQRGAGFHSDRRRSCCLL